MQANTQLHTIDSKQRKYDRSPEIAPTYMTKSWLRFNPAKNLCKQVTKAMSSVNGEPACHGVQHRGTSSIPAVGVLGCKDKAAARSEVQFVANSSHLGCRLSAR